MDQFRVLFMGFWRSPVLYWVVPVSMGSHAISSIYLMFTKRTMKHLGNKFWTQVASALLPLPLLVIHVVSARIIFATNGEGFSYHDMFGGLLSSGEWPMLGLFTLALVLIWLHGCIGIKKVVENKSVFARIKNAFYLASFGIPFLAILGTASALIEINTHMYQEEHVEVFETNKEEDIDDGEDKMSPYIEIVFMTLLGSIVAGFLSRQVWIFVAKKKETITVRYDTGTRVKVSPGTKLLEASRLAGVPHASACGGNGRCSTCRARVLTGFEHLPEPESIESKVLERVSAPPNVRLACQVPVHRDVSIHPLIKEPKAADGYPQPSYTDGEEVEITVMFADLRGFTKLSHERPPFDVVYLLNQYFELMGEAIEESDGYIDKFIGDGIMSIFGIRSGPNIGARQALGAAIRMGQTLDELNLRLEGQIEDKLAIGIGLHKGPAILGEMGYGRAKSVTAIGDCVNMASRIEAACSEIGVELVVSAAVVQAAGVTLDLPERELEIRGANEPVSVYAVPVAGGLKPARTEPVSA